ncbi:hypothetical protein BN1708_009174 [Verticillium longisporum]|uniref:Nucleoside phosphorylase domain-containing protein n=1 Tax=Verticillium longisporum TaxID=100787 RepID=A0A0G4KDT9_VERLO|nr:hypothetical protein BN1708_009174 [Verticillium longisporum]
MVGIGGGVPSARNDIRLGDVVVGVPQGSHSGVLQYDLGKMAQGEAFETRSHLNKAPSLLRSAVQKFEARYHFDGVHLLDAVEKAAQKIEDGDYYRRPPITSDRLFRSSFTHPSSKPSLPCSQVCKGTSHLQARRARSGRPGDPFVHYGLIASGNQLVKNAVFRDKLAAAENILCFETEAAGLVDSFPSIVIRGICDYSDTHKIDEWQGFAAMMAAAYAADLLREVPSTTTARELQIREVLNTSRHPRIESASRRVRSF